MEETFDSLNLDLLLCCKDIGNRISEFVAKTQFL